MCTLVNGYLTISRYALPRYILSYELPCTAMPYLLNLCAMQYNTVYLHLRLCVQASERVETGPFEAMLGLVYLFVLPLFSFRVSLLSKSMNRCMYSAQCIQCSFSTLRRHNTEVQSHSSQCRLHPPLMQPPSCMLPTSCKPVMPTLVYSLLYSSITSALLPQIH